MPIVEDVQQVMTTWETVMTNAINNANGPDIATIKAGCANAIAQLLFHFFDQFVVTDQGKP
jgi:hypothetical protein